MAKPDKPLLSLGARATIGDALTYQKRGQQHIVRKKPIPDDPKSAAQLAQRQVYRDAIDTWRALTAEEKEAWRGVCPGLSPYHCFMRTELKYAPPPVPIYIGSPAILRATNWPSNYTLVNKEGPADGTGIITIVEIWCGTALVNCVVGTFYPTNGNTLKCRDSVALGAVAPNAKQTFPGLSITVKTDDYIGMFFTSGAVSRDTSGFAGLWYINAENIDPGDEAIYSLADGDAISLYGIGEQAA